MIRWSLRKIILWSLGGQAINEMISQDEQIWCLNDACRLRTATLQRKIKQLEQRVESLEKQTVA